MDEDAFAAGGQRATNVVVRINDGIAWIAVTNL
jgi:hypothetical protein